MQLMAHTPPLAMMLLSDGLKQDEGDAAVQRIVASLLQPREELQEKAFFVNEVLRVFSEKFRLGQQECAHEFWLELCGLIDQGDDSEWTYMPLRILEWHLKYTHNCSECGSFQHSKDCMCATIHLGHNPLRHMSKY